MIIYWILKERHGKSYAYRHERFVKQYYGEL